MEKNYIIKVAKANKGQDIFFKIISEKELLEVGKKNIVYNFDKILNIYELGKEVNLEVNIN